ncbi:uncharacterized protein ACNS7B_021617 isoform 2-T2 [Menidia menidia]
MKLSCCLCFLVLGVFSVSRGQNATTPDHHIETTGDTTTKILGTLPPTQLNDTEDDNLTAVSQPLTTTEVTTVTALPEDNRWSTSVAEPKGNEEENGNVTISTPPKGGGSRTTEESMLRSKMSTPPTKVITSPAASEGSGAPAWAYVILVFIILAIIILCVILYWLRRTTTYSFDLHRPSPGHLNEPTGTFEQVYLDDLDQPFPKDFVITDDLSTSPVTNGTSLPTEEKGPGDENDFLGNDPTDSTADPLSSADLFFDAAEEQQNENNNNPSVCSHDPFVEINLDEPAWSDQLLTSAQASSSVLPFS